MRVSQIMLAKGFGGAERSFVDTTLGLAKRGHAVQAICHQAFSEVERLKDISNIELVPIYDLGEWDPLTAKRILKHLRSFRSEIVHTQLKRAAWHGSRAASILGLPCVSKLHNYVDLKRYQKVHTLFCTTQDQRMHALNSGWKEERIQVIPNFSRLKPVDSAKLPSGPPLRILSYGRYVTKKGFDRLLSAFQRLLESGIDARLVIGGKGPELNRLHRISRELGITEKVELGVWISDVKEALREADIFVIPSLDEPFGIVMLEAMSQGIPIVATKTKGPLEVLDNDSALLVDVGSIEGLFQGLRAVAQDPGAAQERAKRALSVYEENYFVDAVIEKIESAYERVTRLSYAE